MRFSRFLPLAVLALGACSDSAKVTEFARPPLAFIRYVHAVPNAGPTDFKFIDAVEWSPTYAAATFRTVGIYQGARAGTRRIRVFPNNSDINLTSTIIIDTTLNLVAGSRYTIVHVGNAAVANGTRFVVIEDNQPDQSATQIHFRAVNLLAANQDVYATATATTTLVGATAAFAGVAPNTASAFVARATGAFAVQTAASTAPTTSLAGTAVGAGTAGTATADPIGGHSVPGSMFSAFLFPASQPSAIAAWPAPQTAPFQNPAITVITDRQPPRTVPD